MPAEKIPYRVAHRVAGLGSRGRQRFVALGQYAGASICREAKALAPSAWCWAFGEQKGGPKNDAIYYQKALDTSVRAGDPFVHLKSGWIVRRLAPEAVVDDRFVASPLVSQASVPVRGTAAAMHITGGLKKIPD